MPGVDRRLGQVDTLGLGDLLELHEHEVPDLDVAVAVLIGAAGRAARDRRAVVVEDLRARAARAGIAHRPEIVARRDAHDALFGQAGDLAPQRVCLVVVVEDGDPETVRVEAEFACHQIPGELDGEILEVVAEREVAEHLEEGVVARGVADVVEVVVLAARAHAFLRGHRAVVAARLGAGEDVLELHHAGVGEQQRRVVAGHQRARRHDLMAVTAEILQKRRANIVRGLHRSCPSRQSR